MYVCMCVCVCDSGGRAPAEFEGGASGQEHATGPAAGGIGKTNHQSILCNVM